MTRDVGVVIVAGGESTRTSGKELKQFRWVAGKPMLLHSLQSFMARADVVSVVHLRAEGSRNAIDGHAALADQLVGLAARACAALGEVLVQPHGDCLYATLRDACGCSSLRPR